MKKMLLIFSVLHLCIACLASDSTKVNTKQKPNIIYILVDDMGYGDLGCYGQKEIATPNINKLAKDGLRFTRHYSGSAVCAPSRCALMTGLHTGHSKVRGNQPYSELNEKDTTIALRLKNAGYKTGLIGKWGLGEDNPAGLPAQQGFDYFFGYLNQVRAHNHFPDSLYRNNQKVALGNEVINGATKYKGIGSASTNKKVYSQDLFADEAVSFIENNAKNTFFLYLALIVPHANNEFYLVKEQEHGLEVPNYGMYASKNWPNAQKGLAAMITHMDEQIGKLRDKLKQLGIDKNTLIIFTSDNGPHAEGGNDPKFFNSNGGLRGIKRDLYEGGVRVPMIACWPGTVKSGQVTNHISAFWDVMPTLSELANIKTPIKTDGISFVPTLLGKKQKQHNQLYWEFNEQGGKQAVLKGNWKLVKLNVFTPAKTKIELYNLDTDPSEKNDVAAQYPNVVTEMIALLEKEHTESSIYPLTKSKE